MQPQSTETIITLDELYKYKMQNSKLQRALVEERVNNGKNIITGEYIK